MNEITFLHTKSSKITFLTAENCNSKSADNIIKKLNSVNSMYNTRGFSIDILHRNNKFNLNALREHIRPESLNICEKGKHITIIEKYMQTINQGVRCATHSVTYKRYTKLRTRSLVEFVIHSRNSFPQKFSISKRIGSSTILLGKSSTDFNTKITFFG